MVVVWRYTRGGGGTRAPPAWSGPGTHVPVLTRRHDTLLLEHQACQPVNIIGDEYSAEFQF